MKLLLSIALLVTAITANPLVTRQQLNRPVCSGATSNTVCCATDVLNLADLDCAPPTTTPRTETEFRALCITKGQQPKCCALPILGQALFCSDPAKDPASTPPPKGQ